MILLWIERKFAKDISYGKNLAGVSYERERPDMIILRIDEIKSFSSDRDLDFIRRREYIRHLSGAVKSGSTSDVVIC